MRLLARWTRRYGQLSGMAVAAHAFALGWSRASADAPRVVRGHHSTIHRCSRANRKLDAEGPTSASLYTPSRGFSLTEIMRHCEAEAPGQHRPESRAARGHG
jgi:hypothetical protein